MHRVGKRQIIGIVIVAIVALVLALFAWTFLRPFERDPETALQVPASANEQEETMESTEPAPTEAKASTIDPANVSTIALEPLAVVVSYVKGIPGFSYSISETGAGTQYAELYSEQLVGTKCTDDTGTFALIVKNPESQEDQTTLALKTEVGDDTYGLSLPSNACTSNATLFAEYQAAFKDGFGLLKAI